MSLSEVPAKTDNGGSGEGLTHVTLNTNVFNLLQFLMFLKNILAKMENVFAHAWTIGITFQKIFSKFNFEFFSIFADSKIY